MEVALKDVGKLAPLAVVLGVVGIVLVWMLTRQMALGTWLLAAFLLGHGLVHVMFAVPAPAGAEASAEYPFDPARSWLVTSNLLGIGTLKIIVVALVAAVVMGYALTALATVGILVPADWWPGLLIASTIGSLVLMVIGLAPNLLLGVAIDVVLLWAAFASAWSPTSAGVA